MAIEERMFGWIDDPIASALIARSNDYDNQEIYRTIKSSGLNKVALLHRIYENQLGKPFPVWDQGIGDCVSFGYALAVSVLMAVEIAYGDEEVYPADAATEPIYGGSRVEIGGGQIPCDSDGSIGGWGAKWVMDYGVLLRKSYPAADLTDYDKKRAKNWGCHGVPDSLEQTARANPVKSVFLVQSYAEARDAIANGYPVVVCSTRGFDDTRDSEGFAAPLGTWAHCMCFVAVDDVYKRPGLLCCNSWGRNWIDGPKRHHQPDGSFWVDADVADRMLSRGDSYALSNFSGFKKQDIEPLMKKLDISLLE